MRTCVSVQVTEQESEHDEIALRQQIDHCSKTFQSRVFFLDCCAASTRALRCAHGRACTVTHRRDEAIVELKRQDWIRKFTEEFLHNASSTMYVQVLEIRSLSYAHINIAHTRECARVVPFR